MKKKKYIRTADVIIYLFVFLIKSDIWMRKKFEKYAKYKYTKQLTQLILLVFQMTGLNQNVFAAAVVCCCRFLVRCALLWRTT